MGVDSNSKRIAKNTLLLYLRMFMIMGISIYTSRVILNALGVNDFGIYNVVGGFVSLFAVVNASLVSAIVRFITTEQGVGNLENEKKIFCTSLNVEIIVAIIALILAETLGLWFLNERMVIPTEKLFAANVVYQLSLASFVISLISIPYTASIVAHEKMSAFAYISIVDAVWKLVVAYIICLVQDHRLIVYALLLSFVSILVQFIYVIYCKRHFPECIYHLLFDKEILGRMLRFAGWETIGSSACVVRDQGLNVMLNLFFGPAVNAARGISMQVYAAVSNFVNNFSMALNPQIYKAYAQDNREYLMKLVFNGARLSFYLMFVLSLPILVNTPYILELWLKNVPDHTVTFVRLVLITGLISTLSETLVTTQNATGNNKWYQIIIGGTNFLTLPIAYLFLWLGEAPEIVFIVTLFIEIIRLFLRLPILKRMVDIDIRRFLREVIFIPVLISVESSIIPYITNRYVDADFINFVLISLLCVVCVLALVYTQGLNREERQLVISQAGKMLKRVRNR